jgi:excisionase family DNA binding protein
MTQTPSRGKLLKPAQVADFLNISRAGIYRLVGEGQLVALKVRGSLRIFEESVDDYLSRQSALFALENGESE